VALGPAFSNTVKYKVVYDRELGTLSLSGSVAAGMLRRTPSLPVIASAAEPKHTVMVDQPADAATARADETVLASSVSCGSAAVMVA